MPEAVPGATPTDEGSGRVWRAGDGGLMQTPRLRPLSPPGCGGSHTLLRRDTAADTALGPALARWAMDSARAATRGSTRAHRPQPQGGGTEGSLALWRVALRAPGRQTVLPLL